MQKIKNNFFFHPDLKFKTVDDNDFFACLERDNVEDAFSSRSEQRMVSRWAIDRRANRPRRVQNPLTRCR